MSDVDKIIELIKTPSKSVLALHLNPDGDSIGSNLALARILKQHGHQVEIVSCDQVPQNFLFLEDIKLINHQNPCLINWQKYDIFWALDVTKPERYAEELKKIDIKIIRIDHHPTVPGNFGDIVIAEPDAASTSEILIKIIKSSTIKIDKTTAEYLLIGSVSDTHYFLNSNTNKNVFDDISYLMQFKIDYEKIMFYLTRNIYFEDLILISKALEKALLIKDKHCVIIPIDYSMWVYYGKSFNKKDFLEQYIKSIKGTDFGIVITEKKKGQFNLSFRSRKPSFDVERLAKKFGGGGHKVAAGAVLKADNINQAVDFILKRI